MDNRGSVYVNTLFPGTYPTYVKYALIQKQIESYVVGDKRKIFRLMRENNNDTTVNSFFPCYGLTAGEFSVWYVLRASKRNTTSKFK
jgi:hypothetical protein